MFYFALSIFIAVSAVVFALSNSEIVSIKFLFWKFDGSLAFILILTFVLGVASTLAAVLPSYIRSHLGVHRLKSKVSSLENQKNENKTTYNSSQIPHQDNNDKEDIYNNQV